MMRLPTIVFLFSLLLIPAVLAHGTAAPVSAAERIGAETVLVAVSAYAIIGLSVLVSLLLKKKNHNIKTLLFLLIATPALLATAYIAVATVGLNLRSATGGPVHWHADFELWHCGEQLELVDPEGLSNAVGTPVVHEHNDNRIHIEGVLASLKEATLHSFIDAIGGALSGSGMRLETTHGLLSVRNGDLCGSQPGTLQGFVYRITNPDPTKKNGFVAVQEKLADLAEYTPFPYSIVPPGDCLIIEFDTEKERTDKICASYELALQKGELTYAS